MRASLTSMKFSIITAFELRYWRTITALCQYETSICICWSNFN